MRVYRYDNLLGKTFGNLTVIEDLGSSKDGHLWKCRCSCGNEISVLGGTLKCGDKKSCGCLSRNSKNVEDLTGKKFGNLYVIEQFPKNTKLPYKKLYYDCKCDCGNWVRYSHFAISNGYYTSCGCNDGTNLIGKKFGKLTPIERIVKIRTFSQPFISYKCKCECGNEITFSESQLMSGSFKSCGCSNHNVLEDLTGKQFGELTVIGLDEETMKKMKEEGKKVVRWWKCKCSCGNYTSVPTYKLNAGKTTSCGHKAYTAPKELHTTHGESNTRLFDEWCHMRHRCNCVTNSDYDLYGGRGISVCPEWNNSYENFRDWALANGYKDYLTIERKNVNGNYCPSNCTWILNEEQAYNRRDTIRCSDGVSIAKICRVFNLSLSSAKRYLFKNGGTTESVLKHFGYDIKSLPVIKRIKELKGSDQSLS